MGTVTLIALRDSALSVDEALSAVRRPGAGGLVVFAGAVRDDDHGRAVRGLDYSGHPSAEPVLRQVAERVAAAYDEVQLAALHRLGDLAVGELSVVVAASAPHRAEAFEAARRLIDELKAQVPVWKHQLFSDGGEEWVNSA